MCMQAGDDKGTLKFLVQHDGQRAQSDGHRQGRSGSVSSRSSVGDQDSNKSVSLHRSRAANVRRSGMSSDDGRSPPNSARSPQNAVFANQAGPEHPRADSPVSDRSGTRRTSGQARDGPVVRTQQPTSWHEGSVYPPNEFGQTRGALSPPLVTRRAESHSGPSRPMMLRNGSQTMPDGSAIDEHDQGSSRARAGSATLRPQEPYSVHNARSMEDLRAEFPQQHQQRRVTSGGSTHQSGQPVYPHQNQPYPLMRQSSGDPLQQHHQHSQPFGHQDHRNASRHPEILRPQTAHPAGHQAHGPRPGDPPYYAERGRTPSFGSTRPPVPPPADQYGRLPPQHRPPRILPNSGPSYRQQDTCKGRLPAGLSSVGDHTHTTTHPTTILSHAPRCRWREKILSSRLTSRTRAIAKSPSSSA